MSSNDIIHFASVERKLSTHLAENGYKGLVDLPDFPFRSLADVNEAYQMKLIDFTVPYHQNGIFSFGTKNQRLISLLISFSLIGNIIGNTGFAIINQEWVFLIGASLAIIGFLISTPYNRALPLLIAASAAILFTAFLKDNLGLIRVCGQQGA